MQTKMRKDKQTLPSRRLQVALLLAGAVFIAAAGLLIPEFYLRHLQARSARVITAAEIGTAVPPDTTGTYETKPLSIEVLSVITQGVYLMDGGLDYHEPLPGQMRESEAVYRLKQEVEEMTRRKLLPEGSGLFTDAQYTAILANYGREGTDAQNDGTYDVWDISIYRRDMTITAALHAQSGKILSIGLSIPRTEEGQGTEESRQMLKAFAATFRTTDAAEAYVAYLGLEGSILRVDDYEDDHDNSFVTVYLSRDIQINCFADVTDVAPLYLSYDVSG